MTLRPDNLIRSLANQAQTVVPTRFTGKTVETTCLHIAIGSSGFVLMAEKRKERRKNQWQKNGGQKNGVVKDGGGGSSALMPG